MAGLLSLVLWWRVLLGQRVLVAGDVLYGLLPWIASKGAHTPSNPIVSDITLQTLAWQTAVRASIAHGRLPLWNPFALAGSPLLANDQTAPFAPLTLLTLPFSPAHAVSLMMIAKLWIAGIGTALFLRQLGAGGAAACFGGIAFATSSYMVVWLGYPNSTVAALLPLGFASVEWYLRHRRPAALAVVAADVGAMFLAGHAPSEVHLLGALGLYTGVRLVGLAPGGTPRWKVAAALLAAAVVGVMVGAVQVAPFVEALQNGIIIGGRLGSHAGAGHLSAGSLLTWLAPNSRGNPAIDGLAGRLPNYSESTGFAGVGALLLAPLGVAWLWRAQRSAATAMVALLALSGAVVYGPLSPIAGRLPVLEVTNNARLIAFICFGVACLGGLGVEEILRRRHAPFPALHLPALIAAGIAGAALVVAWVILYERRAAVDGLLPAIHGHIGFWIAVALASALAAGSLAVAGLAGAGRLAASGLLALALVEAMLFAWPFNRSTDPAQVPPPSQAMSWLAAHADGGQVAAEFPVMLPESATLYGLRDVGGYDDTISARVRDYWTSADPGFSITGNITALARPRPTWLAAAGVSQLVVPGSTPPEGLKATYTGEGVTIAAIPAARPFAFAARTVAVVNSPRQAASELSPDPLAIVAVEGGCCAGAQGGATVAVLERGYGIARLRVVAAADTTVVVEQAYYPGWHATVDGRAVDVRPANILFQAVRVPGGTHDVTLTYEPASFWSGLVVTVIGLLGVLGLVLAPRLAARLSGRRAPAE